MQRFQLIVYPDISKDWENVDRWPESEARNQAYAIYKNLSEIDPAVIGVEQDGENPWFLRFTEQAQEFFNEWFTDSNCDLRSDAFEHPALESHFAKYKSLMPSLALLFHLAENAGRTFEGFEGSALVNLRAAEMAAAWCGFLMERAKRIYGLGIGATAIHARTLATHLQAGDLQDAPPATSIFLRAGRDCLEPKRPSRR